MHPLLGILLVLGLLGVLMLAVRAAQRQWRWDPELARKSVHVGMGMVCLTFPWLFRQTWPVWLLAGLAVASLGIIRFAPRIFGSVGQVLGGVQRESWGELYFPIGVAAVFWLAHGNPLLFRVPVLILALADALAALIGHRYGFSKYETDDGWKSVEGSTAFFLVAFVATLLPLLYATEVGWIECLMIATVMGLILMLMEAIAWRGLDNLFIPLVSFVCLIRLIHADLSHLTIRLVVLTVVVAGLSIWRRTTRLTPAGAIGAALVLYVAWAVGEWYWLIAPVMTGVAYTALCHRAVSAPQRHTVHAVACIGGVGLGWLCLAQVIGTVNTIYAYGVGYGANLAMIALAFFSDHRRNQPIPLAALKAVLLGYLPLAAPYCFVWRQNPNWLPLAIGALGLVVLAIVAFAWWQPGLRACPADSPRWTRQGVVSAFASGLAFGLISLLEPWSRSFR